MLIKLIYVAFFIAAFGYGGEGGVNLAVAGAVLPVVVNNAAGLQMRIHRDAAQVFKAAFFQLAADGIGQAVAGGNVAFGVLVI